MVFLAGKRLFKGLAGQDLKGSSRTMVIYRPSMTRVIYKSSRTRIIYTVLPSDPCTRLLDGYNVKMTGKNCPNYTMKEEMK